VLVRIGCSTPFGDVTSLAGFVPEFARAVEDRGLDSIWIGEHTHLPLDSKHAYTENGRIPDRYKRFPDPWITLTAAAAVTRTIRLGTAVCLVAEHNPLSLAKQIATVDQLSAGRVEFGVGYGWNAPEMKNNGVDPARKRATFREKLRAVKELWTTEHTAFSGEFVNFTDSWSLPQPVQRPHPPILIGGAPTPGTFKDIAELCDGYLPVRDTVGERLGEHVRTLRRCFEEAGRDPATLQLTLSHPETSFGRVNLDKFAARLPGKQRIEDLAEMGFARITCSIPNQDRSLMYRALDHLADLAAAVK
jgi:probable F420-dependent oxidoreductase